MEHIVEKVSESQVAPHDEETLSALKRLELRAESLFFTTRWIAAPIYACLAAALGALSLRALFDTYALWVACLADKRVEMIDDIVELVDLSMFSGLVVISMFSGYENFISRMSHVHSHPDRPKWLLHIKFPEIKKLTLGTISVMGCVNILKIGYLGQPMELLIKWVIIIATTCGAALSLAIMERVSKK